MLGFLVIIRELIYWVGFLIFVIILIFFILFNFILSFLDMMCGILWGGWIIGCIVGLILILILFGNRFIFVNIFWYLVSIWFLLRDLEGGVRLIELISFISFKFKYDGNFKIGGVFFFLWINDMKVCLYFLIFVINI